MYLFHSNSEVSLQTSISLQQIDIVFGRNGHGPGKHSIGTKKLREILKQTFESHLHADHQGRRRIEHAVLLQVKSELPPGSRFLRIVPPRGVPVKDSYRLLSDKEARRDISLAFKSLRENGWYKKKKAAKKTNSSNNAFTAPPAPGQPQTRKPKAVKVPLPITKDDSKKVAEKVIPQRMLLPPPPKQLSTPGTQSNTIPAPPTTPKQPPNKPKTVKLPEELLPITEDSIYEDLVSALEMGKAMGDLRLNDLTETTDRLLSPVMEVLLSSFRLQPNGTETGIELCWKHTSGESPKTLLVWSFDKPFDVDDSFCNRIWDFFQKHCHACSELSKGIRKLVSSSQPPIEEMKFVGQNWSEYASRIAHNKKAIKPKADVKILYIPHKPQPRISFPKITNKPPAGFSLHPLQEVKFCNVQHNDSTEHPFQRNPNISLEVQDSKARTSKIQASTVDASSLVHDNNSKENNSSAKAPVGTANVGSLVPLSSSWWK